MGFARLYRRAVLGLALTVFAAATGAAGFPGLPGFGASEAEAIPSAGEALQLRAATWAGGVLTVDIEVAPGAYLYASTLSVESLTPDVALEARPPLHTERIDDPHFGVVAIWRGAAQAQYSATRPPQRVRVRYQGCLENKVCYPPQTRDIAVQAIGS